MAKIERLYVQVGIKVGFKHSYSSAEAVLGETVVLAPTDSPREVRERVLDRLSKAALDEAVRIREEYDTPDLRG